MEHGWFGVGSPIQDQGILGPGWELLPYGLGGLDGLDGGKWNILKIPALPGVWNLPPVPGLSHFKWQRCGAKREP